MLNQISGGVCAAKGFTAAGVHCGVKAGSSPDKNDLALILSEKECAAVGVEGFDLSPDGLETAGCRSHIC